MDKKYGSAFFSYGTQFKSYRWHKKVRPVPKNMHNYHQMSLVMRKPAFCICKNKDADQRLCLRFSESTIPLLPKYEISSL